MADNDKKINMMRFQSKLRWAATSCLGLLTLGIVLVFVTKTSSVGFAIGWGMSLGLPFIFGIYTGLFAMIGTVDSLDPLAHKKRITLKKFFGRAFLALVSVVLLIIALYMSDKILKLSGLAELWNIVTHGLFCLVTGTGVFIIPILFGLFVAHLIGKELRHWIVNSEQKKIHTTVLLLILSLGFPSALDRIEAKLGFRDQLPVESVLTVRDLPSQISSVWSNLQFYEDTGSEAPLLFALGFPKPIRTEGHIQQVGDVTRCVYDKGYLVKKVTRIEHTQKESHLGFKVIEQVNIEDNAIQLVDGSFHLVQRGNDVVQLELKTKYKALMTPRWMWRPIEKLVARALHNHVVDKIEIEINESPIQTLADK